MDITFQLEAVNTGPNTVEFRASITEPDDPFGPPAAEEFAATPDDALKKLLRCITINDEVASEYGIDPDTLTNKED